MTNRQLLVVSYVLFTSAFACGGGSNAPKDDELREIVLRNPPPEERGGDLFQSAKSSHREVLQKIDEADV